MKLDRDKIRELHGQAVEDIQKALKTQSRHGTSDETVVKYRASAELEAAVGADEAERLQYRAYGEVSDMLHNRDELKRTAESAKRELDRAIQAVTGEGGHVNQLGILQSTGPRVDVLAATFHLRVESAIGAWADVLCALEEARQEDAEGLRAAAEAIQTNRDTQQRLAAKARDEAQKARKEKADRECEANVSSSSRFGRGNKCTKTAKKVATLEDGTKFRFCGTHLRSATHKDTLEVGDFIHAGGRMKRVTAIDDFAG